MQADDLKNMDPDKMGDMLGGAGKKKPKKTRSQYRRRLVEFYETYGLTDKARARTLCLLSPVCAYACILFWT